jgi:hypothetical protein
MLYWPQVHWLKLMAVMVGSINQVSPLVVLSPCHLPFLFSINVNRTESARDRENALRAVDGRTRGRIIACAAVAVLRMPKVSRRARLQPGADTIRWQESYVSRDEPSQ